tara:strand:+ start:1023 stop:1592 length:570 start_codon:yes stop_codon:yes gene_type:complete
VPRGGHRQVVASQLPVLHGGDTRFERSLRYHQVKLPHAAETLTSFACEAYSMALEVGIPCRKRQRVVLTPDLDIGGIQTALLHGLGYLGQTRQVTPWEYMAAYPGVHRFGWQSRAYGMQECDAIGGETVGHLAHEGGVVALAHMFEHAHRYDAVIPTGVFAVVHLMDVDQFFESGSSDPGARGAQLLAR